MWATFPNKPKSWLRPLGATHSPQRCQAQPWGLSCSSPRDVCPLSWPVMQYTATARNSVATTSATTMPEMVGASTSMQFWHTGKPKRTRTLRAQPALPGQNRAAGFAV